MMFVCGAAGGWLRGQRGEAPAPAAPAVQAALCEDLAKVEDHHGGSSQLQSWCQRATHIQDRPANCMIRRPGARKYTKTHMMTRSPRAVHGTGPQPRSTRSDCRCTSRRRTRWGTRLCARRARTSGPSTGCQHSNSAQRPRLCIHLIIHLITPEASGCVTS